MNATPNLPLLPAIAMLLQRNINHYYRLLVGVLLLAVAVIGIWPTADAHVVDPRQPIQTGATFIDVRANVLRHARKAEALMDLRRYPEAIQALQVGLALNPDSALAGSLYHNLGLCYRQIRNFPLAIISHQRAIRLAPGFKMYVLHLALDYKAAGVTDQAIAQLSTWDKTNDTELLLSYLE